MLRNFLYLFLWLACGQASWAQISHFGRSLQKQHPKTPEFVKQGHIDSTVRFIENKNQWDKNVLFRAAIPNGFAYLLDDGFHYLLHEGATKPKDEKNASANTHPHGDLREVIKGHGVRVKFKNALKGTKNRVRTENELITKYNYFLGNDEKKWGYNASAYNQVGYQNVYEGIDVKMFGQYKTLKYEFHVAAYADPQKIRLAYEGVDYIKIRERDEFLEFGTSVGKVMEQKPYCYQIIRGQEVQVPAKFKLVGNELSFEFPQGYDKGFPLVIDPVLIFSTYSGSTADNWGSTATFDEAGRLYSGGIVLGEGFKVTTGAFQTQFKAIVDIGLLVFNPAATSPATCLLYATYIGGRDREFPTSMIVDKDNNLYMLATTGSDDLPRHRDALDDTFNGGTLISSSTFPEGQGFSKGTDLLLVKFNYTLPTNITPLRGITYVGGTANDGINIRGLSLRNYGDTFRGEILVDTLGFVYVASVTTSTDFIPAVRNFTPAKPNLTGTQDGVLFKMDNSLSTLIWCTYLGGNGIDNAYSMKVDKQLNVYVTGGTNSTNLRSMVEFGAPSPMIPLTQGSDDGYIAKFSPNGVCKQITHLGTSQADQCYLIDLDDFGFVYVVGQTRGNYPVFPTTGTYTVANGAQFVHKVSNDLTESIRSIRFGAGTFADGLPKPDISPTAFLVNTCGNIYITGWGANLSDEDYIIKLSTTGLTATPDGDRTTTDGQDFYIMILEQDFKSRLYATFFGTNSTSGSGDHVDGGTSRFDKKGIIYHAVCASCGFRPPLSNDNFPVTSNGLQTNNATNCNNAAFKYDIGTLKLDFTIRDVDTGIIIQKACKFPAPARFVYEGIGVTKWNWAIDGVPKSTASAFTHNFPAPGEYLISLIGENAASCLKTDTVKRIFRISQIEVEVAGKDTICVGQSKQLNATVDSTNPFTFTWTPATGLDNPNSQTPLASPATTTTYTVTAKDNNNCEVKGEVLVEVIPDLEPDFELINVVNGRGCVPSFFTAKYNFAKYKNLTWVWTVTEASGTTTFPNVTQITRTVAQAGEVKIRLQIQRNGKCAATVDRERNITFILFKLNASADANICTGESTPLNVTETPTGTPVTYTWTPATGLSNPNIANPVASPTVTTRYIVTGENPDGCIFKDTVVVNVTNKPIVDFDIELGSDCAKPTTVTFTNKSKNTALYQWRILLGTDLVATFTDQAPAPYNLTKAGKYKIELTGRNGSCTTIFSKEIEVEDNLSLPPNTITPNSDGKNDTFAIAPERIGYKIEIYNRWGTEMFKADNYKDDWGKGIEAGSYYYYLTSPKGVRCKGWINVMK